METTLLAEQPNDPQPPTQHEQAKGRHMLRSCARGIGALLVRLGTQEYDSSTRVVRGATGAFLVYLGARIDQIAPHMDVPGSSR